MSGSRSLGSMIVRLASEGLPAYKADMGAAADATQKTTKTMDDATAATARQGAAFGKHTSVTNGMVESVKMLGTAFAGFKALEVMVNGGEKLIATQREFDVLNASLITVTGSAGRADQAFGWIQKFAATTPYQLTEVTDAFVKMKALGLDASEKSLASYGNTASAMGKGLNQMIEAVADAATGEFERLKEFGIKARQNGDQVSLTFQGVTTNIGNNAREITQYLQDIGNVQFSGAMEQRMKTLDGAISNLKDNWDGLFRTINKGGFADAASNDVRKLNDVLQGLKDTLENSQQAHDGFVKQMANGAGFVIGTAAVGTANSVFNGFNWTVNALTGNLLHLNENVNLLPKSLMTNEQRAAAVANELTNAQTNLATLQAQLAKAPDDIYLRSRAWDAHLLVLELLKAKDAQDALGKDPRDQSGFKSRSESYKDYADQQAKDFADKSALMTKLSGVPKDYIDRVKELGDLNARGLLTQSEFNDAMAKAHGLLKKGTAVVSEAAKGLALYNDLMDAGSGYTATYAEEQNKLAAAYKKGAISYAQYATAVQLLVDKQPLIVKAHEAEKKALEDMNSARDAELKAHANELAALTEKAQKLEDEVMYYGMSKAAIEELTTARMLDQIEVLKGFDNSDEEIARIEQVIAARKRLAAAGTALEMSEASKKASDQAKKDWESAADSINKDITDALMRGFESGKGFGENLKATLENMFKTMVLRPVISAIVSPVSQDITSSLMGGAGSGSDMGFGQMMSLFGSSGSSGGMGDLLGSSSMGKLDIGGYSMDQIGAGLSYLSAAKSLSEGKYGAGIGTAIGTLWGGPIGGAIGGYFGGMVDSAAGGGGGPKSESSYGSMAGLGNTSTTGAAGAYSTSLASSWKSLSSRLGLSGDLNVSALTSMDPQGNDLTDFYAQATLNGKLVSDRVARMGGRDAAKAGRSEADLQAAMNDEATRILFEALKASDLPQQYKTYLDSMGSSVTDMSTAMNTVTIVHDFTAALDALPFENLKSMSFDAAKGLIEVSGGLDALKSNLSTYYSNYYTQEEQRAQTIANINAATVGSGLDAATATKESFRALVEAQDLSTESGRKTYAQLLSVSGAFAGVATEAETAAKAVNKSFMDLFTSVQDSLTALTKSISDQRAAVADSVAGINPTQMTLAQIQAGIAGSQVGLPSNTAVQAALAVQDAALAKAASATANLQWATTSSAQKQALGSASSAMQSGKSALDSANAWVARADAVINSPKSDWDGNIYEGIRQGLSGISRTVGASIGDHLQNGRGIGYDRYLAGNAQSAAQSQLSAATAVYNTALAAYNALVATYQAAVTDASSAQKAADAAVKKAGTDYAAAMSAYAGDAEKATTKLGKLREETVKYYEAQKALSELMSTSAANLRAAVAGISVSQLDPAATTAQKQREFAQYYSLALATSGADKAAYADKMTAALPALSEAIKSTSTLRDWTLATARLAAQSNTVAGQLDAAAAVDYQADSLAALQSIDATLAGLEAGTNTAAGIISAAVAAGADLTAAGLRNVVTTLGGVPSFDVGTNYVPRDMLARVHEGEEIVPKRYNTGGPQIVVGSSSKRLEAMLQALTDEVARLRADNSRENAAIATHSALTADSTRRMHSQGVMVYTDPAEPIKTVAA